MSEKETLLLLGALAVGLYLYERGQQPVYVPTQQHQASAPQQAIDLPPNYESQASSGLHGSISGNYNPDTGAYGATISVG